MNKTITLLIILLLAGFSCSHADECVKMRKPTLEEQKKFDKMLDERLKLTDEQKAYIQANRPKHRKEMEETINKMEELHSKIKDIYSQNLPKYQADIMTAPYKTELAILKQNAQNQKAQNKKNFENILTKEQKKEFEKMKHEHKKHKVHSENHR